MAAEESREAMWARMATERKVKDEPVIENVINAIAKPFQLWNPNLSARLYAHRRQWKIHLIRNPLSTCF